MAMAITVATVPAPTTTMMPVRISPTEPPATIRRTLITDSSVMLWGREAGDLAVLGDAPPGSGHGQGRDHDDRDGRDGAVPAGAGAVAVLDRAGEGILVDGDHRAQRRDVVVERPVGLAWAGADVVGDSAVQAALGQGAQHPVVALVDLVGEQRFLRRGALTGERDVVELGAQVAAELDVRVVRLVGVDLLGQGRVVLADADGPHTGDVLRQREEVALVLGCVWRVYQVAALVGVGVEAGGLGLGQRLDGVESLDLRQVQVAVLRTELYRRRTGQAKRYDGRGGQQGVDQAVIAPGEEQLQYDEDGDEDDAEGEGNQSSGRRG